MISNSSLIKFPTPFNNSNSFISHDENKKNKGKFIERQGDWICERCKNLNFSFRVVCNRCKISKNESLIFMEENELNNKQNQMFLTEFDCFSQNNEKSNLFLNLYYSDSRNQLYNWH